MFSNPVSLAAGAVLDTEPPEIIHIADLAGFDMTGLWVSPAKWDRIMLREVRRMLDDTAIKVLDVELITIDPGPPKADHFKTIDIGAEIGAKNVIITSTDPDRTNTINCYETLCQHAASVGLRAIMEFAPFMAVATLEDALDVVHSVEHPSAGLLVDTLHLYRAGYSANDLRRIPSELIPYVQLCDAPTVAADTSTEGLREESLDGRLLPGEGELPLPDMLGILPDDIPLSLEIRSKALRDNYPDPEIRAIRIYQATRAFLEQN